MSEYRTPLVATWLSDDPLLLRVDANLDYWSDLVQALIRVPAGSVTDLTSVPRIPFIYDLLGGLASRAGATHDQLYTSKIYPRDVADKILREACIVCGMPAWKAQLMYWGVRIGGASHWDK